uniref:Basic leucine zipper ATF-like transcription factor 2 n=1 Tax=Sparus aurata TaxID=8175 RepID=A0A671TL65_SPAAU
CSLFSKSSCIHSLIVTNQEGDGQPAGHRGTKRQEKNRDAARKSRKKQTERADELHEELQRLEQSNSALQKEIALLRKDFQLYTTALERHKPVCSLRDSAAPNLTPCQPTRLHGSVTLSSFC